MKLRLLVSSALFFNAISLLPAQARIGETLDDCVKRYGPSEKIRAIDLKLLPDSQVYAFSKGGLRVIAEFVDGQVCLITFSRLAKDGSNISRPLSEEQIWLLLQPNGGNRQWSRAATPSTMARWVTEDRSLIADYSTTRGTLTIYTADAAQKVGRASKSSGIQLDLTDF